jgi:hypothetical protein
VGSRTERVPDVAPRDVKAPDVKAPNATEDVCTGGLIGTAQRSCPRNDDESVESDTKRGGTNDNRRDGPFDSPKVEGKRTVEEQQRKLQYQRQRPHHAVKVPGNDAIELPLSILAPPDGRPSHVDRGVSVQPLFPKHRKEGGEE